VSRSLKRSLACTARILGSWFQIPLGERLCLCFSSAYIVLSLRYASCCVSYNSLNRAVYTTIICTNKNKSILTYQHSFIGKMCFATSFYLHEIIIRRIYKNSTWVVELCFFNMDPYYYNLFHFHSEYCLFVK
jgi:hypothetical protein